MKIASAEKKIVDKLVEECNENIDGNEMIYNGTLNYHKKVCGSCTIYIVLSVIAFLIIMASSNAFIYFHWYLKKSDIGVININPSTETVIY